MPLSDTDYELLDRIDNGEQIFRVDRTKEGLRAFADQVDRLLSLRARQWIRLPDAHISRGADGQSLVIGPCELTPLGREELQRDRRLGPRRGLGASPCHQSTLVDRTIGAGVRIREKLGDTPVGALYRGEYPTGLEVAVVILGTASDDSAALSVLRQRFQQAIQIHHPNLSAIYEVGETHDGLVYVLAERLAGELLSETLAKRGPLPLEERLDLWRQAAAGLQAAHDAHWIHGNLSPDSILLAQTAEGGAQVKLIGFSQIPLRRSGTGRLSDRSVSTEYASPERIAGHSPD